MKKGKMPPALARYWKTHKRGGAARSNPRARDWDYARLHKESEAKEKARLKAERARGFGVFPYDNQHGGWYLKSAMVKHFKRESDAHKLAQKLTATTGGRGFVDRPMSSVRDDMLPGQNPRGRKRTASARRSSRRSNPPRGSSQVYPELVAIAARKHPDEPHNCDAECRRANHTFEHKFKLRDLAVYGDPSGERIIIERTKR